ncbi:MAG: hypothetical protein KC493_04800 [Bacteriovoracaceae bacterium]|nr:hypothetical protein [Bacteriovoracaceae bacterium]
MKGKLVLVPTPIAPDLPLEEVAKTLIHNSLKDDFENTRIVVEEAKEGRRRWLKWGFPRESIEDFILYNEHNHESAGKQIISEIEKGCTVYMMSDGGLPAFCDPGKNLVSQCHRQKLKVTATPFPHSISLALSLSGFDHDTFVFEGFLPKDNDDRKKRLDTLRGEKRTIIFMDTPYRLGKLISEVGRNFGQRPCFLGLDLGFPQEELIVCKASQIPSVFSKQKREFILIISQS